MQCLHVVAASTTTTAHAALLKRTKVYHSGRRIAMQHGILADDTGDLLAKRQFCSDSVAGLALLVAQCQVSLLPGEQYFLASHDMPCQDGALWRRRFASSAKRFRGQPKEKMMIFVYKDVLTLQGKEKVGSKQCVALIQRYAAGVGHHSQWKEGELVMGNRFIEPGTAIATFVNGEYPSINHGNHVAFFVKQVSGGFVVMDQWANDEEKPLISPHIIHTGGKKKNSKGWWPNGGKNAYAYSIIER